MSLCPVILAGGGGTRLWPLSRAHYPKQFLSLFGNSSMLQETIARLDGIESSIPLLDPILVCNEVHRFLVADQAKEINRELQSIILEPEGRNTAPALTVASQALLDKAEDAVMLMMPADHIISDIPRFQDAIKAGSTSPRASRWRSGTPPSATRRRARRSSSSPARTTAWARAAIGRRRGRSCRACARP